MQLPKRKAAERTEHPDAVVYLKPSGLKRLQDEMKRLKEVEEPQAIQDVAQAVQKGDLSENAEYQESRGRLTRIQNRQVHLAERMKRVILIEETGSDTVQIGSKVTIQAPDGLVKTYEIVGPSETNPSYGRISYLSPIGAALMNHAVDDVVTLTLRGEDVLYRVTEVV
ncbi:MAG: GreA/GreB family elongation factor [Candidatus Uhrbacteria bacterium]|nr:GreA/GreB family elongation factor [Candidatus Uhrbacteria bacterium]